MQVLYENYVPTAGTANKVLWKAKQVWQNILLLYVLVYHRAYLLY